MNIWIQPRFGSIKYNTIKSNTKIPTKKKGRVFTRGKVLLFMLLIFLIAKVIIIVNDKIFSVVKIF